MTVYQAIVQMGAAHPDGVSVTLRQAEQVLVNGTAMVQTQFGWLQPMDGWHDTVGDAYAAAANVIDEQARCLLHRADQLRSCDVSVDRQAILR